MNIALVLQHKLLLGLQHLMSEVARPSVRQTQTPQVLAARNARTPTRPIRASFAPRLDAIHVEPVQRRTMAAPMPLRVLRVVDKDQPRSSTGRMVISGRMADVCAELDRLAAREAALH